MTGSQCASSCDSYSVVEMKIGIIKKGIENEKISFFISSLSFLQVSSTLENFVHPLSESEGIDIRLGGEEDKPTIMMLMKNLVSVRDTCTYHSLAVKTEHQNTCAVHILVLYAATLANAVIKEIFLVYTFLLLLLITSPQGSGKTNNHDTYMIPSHRVGECKVPVVTCSKCFCTSNCF